MIFFTFSVLLNFDQTPFLFFCEESLQMQQNGAHFNQNGFIDKTLIIPGKYDIGKWFRPLETPFIFKNGVPHDIFGMPSGHSNASLFTTAFIFLCLNVVKIKLGFLIYSLFIMSQRVIDNHHTFFQVIVGASVGLLYAYLFYYFSEEKLKGKIEEKPDDNGPL